MAEAKKRIFKPTLKTKLAREDFQRVDLLAKAEGKKSEVVREAVLWYLEHKDELANKPREVKTVLAIKEMTNRIAECGEARRIVGTLYELTWMGLPDEARRLVRGGKFNSEQR